MDFYKKKGSKNLNTETNEDLTLSYKTEWSTVEDIKKQDFQIAFTLR